ncbi:HPr kinase/phosphorylase [Hansschlegelia zhihuaiae]|uniref:Serine/threonine protein kinase n=1 Tax=Hansschlegelia zhihuaiae TaxID=405005 RepID=A0A4Q0MGV8_9HYPH|nr:HPr kinase/phosphatase C-terminal domain-containing protein [Hansschlegelia zhihuaiae]RXF72720.1 serine/threonine protein kinase [Hansschlegelia zhihuaiae]
MTATPSIHANCVVVGERGALIRGASGSGKSALSAALVELARSRGRFARLVADDRTLIERRHGRLIASAPASIAGLIERRGAGIAHVETLREVVLGLVIDLEADPERMPDDAGRIRNLEGVSLPRLVLRIGDPSAPALAFDCLDPGRTAVGCGPLALAFAPQHEKIASSAPERAVHPARLRKGGARRPLTGAQ